MNPAQSTPPARRVHKQNKRADRMRGRRVSVRAAAMLGPLFAGGCITLNAPVEPIVIELNINITQEVIYRLAEDVRENIEANPEIF